MQKNKQQNLKEHLGSQSAVQAELVIPKLLKAPRVLRTLQISGSIFPKAATHIHTQFSHRPLCKQHHLGFRKTETTVIAELCTGQVLRLPLVSYTYTACMCYRSGQAFSKVILWFLGCVWQQTVAKWKKTSYHGAEPQPAGSALFPAFQSS